MSLNMRSAWEFLSKFRLISLSSGIFLHGCVVSEMINSIYSYVFTFNLLSPHYLITISYAKYTRCLSSFIVLLFFSFQDPSA